MRTKLIARLTSFAMFFLLFGTAQALYDPKPDPEIYALQGKWEGSLTYKDYSHPDSTETLPTVVFVALTGPTDLALHYTFADGPGKNVYSYEQMKFNFAGKGVILISGIAKRTETKAKILSDTVADNRRRVVFQSEEKTEKHRYTLDIFPTKWSMKKEEISAAGISTLRNTFEFAR